MRPLPALGDEQTCYDWLVDLLHPEGLGCPRCGARDGIGIHRRHRAPVLDYQCSHCGRVFNAWTGTPLEKTHRRPCEIVQILRGMLAHESTSQLARDLNCQRAQLVSLRRKLEPLAQKLLVEFPAAESPEPSDETRQSEFHDQEPVPQEVGARRADVHDESANHAQAHVESHS